MIDLKRLHKEYLKYEEKSFLKDSADWLGGKNISTSKKKEIYKNYYRNSLSFFLKKIKDIIYSESAFNFIYRGRGDDWDLLQYISFLDEKKLIKINKNGKVDGSIGLKKLLPKPIQEEEIINIIEKKLKTKIVSNNSVLDLVDGFTPKKELDQMPISQESAIFTVKKILDYLPDYKDFLFVGDDDFISLLLSLVDARIPSLVVDADKELLFKIKQLSGKLNLKIKTKEIDLRKKVKLKKTFSGFLCNPPYTEEGVSRFVEYGLSHLGVDGGVVFLTFDTENIGNRQLFLQKFFSNKNLVIQEIISEKIKYPFIMIHKEDYDCFTEMNKFFDSNTIKKNPKLGADLWIFDYVPFKIKRLLKSNLLYRYL
jgi:hypothetical protein